MGWSAGTFSRAEGASQWADDEAANVGIESARHDAQDNDLADGINSCLNKDGENTPTTNLPMGGFAHTNVADATARTQYAKVSQVQDGSYIWGGTSGGSANAQTLTLAPAIAAYAAGQCFRFTAGFSNTAATTLNVNGLGTKNIRLLAGGVDLPRDTIITGAEYSVLYDGTQFILITGQRPCIIHRNNDFLTVSTTTSETTIKSFTIPAPTFNYSTGVRFGLLVEIINSTGGAVNFTFRGKLGATTFYNSGSTAKSVPSSANTRLVAYTGELMASDSIIAGICREENYIGTSDVASGAEVLRVTNMGYHNSIGNGAGSLDLKFTVQMGTSSVSAGIICRQFWVEAI